MPYQIKTKRATLKDVAKAAGVSLASASYAVNGTGSLGEQTRSQILKVAEGLGYRQNLSARAVRTGRSGAIGLVLPDLSNPFFPSLAQPVMQRARQHGYSVFVTVTEGSEELERDAIKLLAERGVDGIIWFPIRDKNTAGMLAEGIPVIVLDRTLPNFESVQADYAEGGRLAAEYLVRLGHRDIGIISGPTDIASMRERCEGAAAYIRAHGKLAFLEQNAFSVDLEPMVAAAVTSRKATAIFAGGDIIALGVIKLATQNGIRVPEDLSVVGFDDVPWAQMSSPALTTIEMPLDDMASEAVEVLLRKIEARTDLRRKVVFETALIERASTAPPPKPKR